MKLLFDHSIFSTQNYGGVSRYYSEIIPRLDRDERIQLSVFAPLHQNSYLASLGFPGLIPSRFRTRRGGQVLKQINEMLTARHLRHNDYDIVHETNFSGRRYSGFSGRVVHTIHDLTPELYPGQFSRYEKVMARRNAVLTSADCSFIAVSQNTKADMMRLFAIDEQRIRVIHHGAPQLPMAPSVERRDDLVLYVGGRHGYKNFGRVIEAMSMSRRIRADVELLIFGGGELSEAEKDRLLQAGIRRFRHASGDDAALARAYRSATLFVYPSLYEGFGLPLLEAMGLGCPVACSNASCFPEIAGPAARYFDPTSSAEMAHTLEALLLSPTYRAQAAVAGRRRAMDFNWDESARQHSEFYAELGEAA